MPIETATGTAQCPECFADVTLTKVMQNEITQCPGCGAELEITSLEPLTLAVYRQGLYLFARDVTEGRVKTFAVERFGGGFLARRGIPQAVTAPVAVTFVVKMLVV